MAIITLNKFLTFTNFNDNKIEFLNKKLRITKLYNVFQFKNFAIELIYPFNVIHNRTKSV